jgi:hypothetical protein
MGFARSRATLARAGSSKSRELPGSTHPTQCLRRHGPGRPKPGPPWGTGSASAFLQSHIIGRCQDTNAAPGSRTSKSSSLDTMMDAPAASASSRYLLSFRSNQSVTRSTGSSLSAAAPRISRMRPRSASVMYLRNFGRWRTSRISVSTDGERQIVACERASSNAHSGVESALSAAPTIELASKTAFGIVGGEFRLDLRVRQPVGTCCLLASHSRVISAEAPRRHDSPPSH